MSTVKATLRVLGILLGSLSVISLAQAVLNVGLVPALEEFITFYRSLAANVFGLLTALFGFIPPQPVFDFWTLSFLGASAYCRTEGIENCRALRGLNLNPQSLWWRIGLWLLFGFSGMGFGFAVSAIYPLTYVDFLHEEPPDLMRGAAMNLFWICAGVILFFVVNAYEPSR